jgi:drug/metabolite transporter (DMT)-like permease
MSRRAWLAFAAMSTIWGIPYLLIKVAIDHGAPPAVVSFARVVLAAAVLLALAAARRSLGSLRGHVRWIAAFAVVEIAIPFPLIALGEEHAPSSLAAIVIATVPLIIALLALRLDPSELPTPRRLAGLVLGLGGVVALVGIDGSGHPDELWGILAILGAAVGYAIGPMILKHRLADLDPVVTMAGSMAVASLLLAPAAALTAPKHAPDVRAFAAIVGLGLVCTALAFVVYNVLISEAGPSRASVITYVNPIVALAAGIALLGERPGVGALAGLVLILGGSWISTDGRVPRFARPAVIRRRARV